MEEDRLRRLAGALRDPQGSSARSHGAQDDIGAAMIELFAGALDRVSAYARQAAQASQEQAAVQQAPPVPPSARRPRFFAGQVLRAEDLLAAQDYSRERQRLVLLLALGSGVATGLTVTCSETATGARVAVTPGMAIDPAGELVALREEARVPVGPQLPAFVCLRYTERPCDPTPVGEEGTLEPTRIEESARVTVEREPPADGVALARLVQREQATVVDAAFRPRHVGWASRNRR